MPNKKQSARSAGSGWLLEVGVLGVDKTLTLLKHLEETLLGAEQVLRNRYLEGVDRKKLPWMAIPAASWELGWSDPPKWLQGDWEKCLTRQTRKLGRKLTQDEWDSLAQDWCFARSEYPGSDENNHLWISLEEHESRQRRKGRSYLTQRHRPGLSRWMLNQDIANLFLAPALDNDTERKKLERIAAHSLALADALKVISGEKKSLPASYAPVYERHLTGETRRKLLEVIKHSSEVYDKRILRLEKELNQIDKRRPVLVAYLGRLKSERKKVGKPKARI
jgi:hypothetical protein